jgi:hypothetical protein
MLAMLFVNSRSKNATYKIFDFMPHDSEPPITIEEAMEKWN